MKKMTISDYLLTRLKEMGIKDVFGVPGDYNLPLLDQIVKFKGLEWVGNCNELNAAYAADGYARVKGISALVTTYGVGELSAINGIAGSYAEYVPVVNIVGWPATAIQTEGSIMHHTLGTNDFFIFSRMFEPVSAAMVVLNNPEMAAEAIDQALEICWVKKQPVYIGLPSDMVSVEIEAPTHPLHLEYPDSDPKAVKEIVTRAAEIIRQAKSPVVLVDMCAVRHPMRELIHKLLAETDIPFATLNMGKGILNESSKHYLGMYSGIYSTPGVQKRVEKSDCVIFFGSLLSDFNTGEFTASLNIETNIEIHSHYVQLNHAFYPEVYFNAVIPKLTKELKGYKHVEKIKKIKQSTFKPKNELITQARFWQNMSAFFKKNDIILAETGTSMFGLIDASIPDQSTIITQTLWASIGYTVGAVLGTALADRSRRSILFVGDGSFQLTAQELSTVVRHKLTPIVFLLNNDGYTIERVIHGPKMLYNDIQPWCYTAIPKAFGENVFTATVKTEQELANILTQLDKHRDQMCFIEVMMDRLDCPENLRQLGRACELKNEG